MGTSICVKSLGEKTPMSVQKGENARNSKPICAAQLRGKNTIKQAEQEQYT